VVARSSPFVVSLSKQDRSVLEQRARCYSSSYCDVVRAKIVLLASEGQSNVAIAKRLDVHVGVVDRSASVWASPGLRSRRGGCGQGHGL
jgi:hypothetical protein